MQALASMTTILTNNSHWKVRDKIRDLPYECEETKTKIMKSLPRFRKIWNT